MRVEVLEQEGEDVEETVVEGEDGISSETEEQEVGAVVVEEVRRRVRVQKTVESKTMNQLVRLNQLTRTPN